VSLFQVAAASTDPVTVDDAKLHCRIEVADDDELIAGLITAAVEYTESFIHRKLLTETWADKRRGFSSCGPIVLSFPPVSAITSITYLDGAGDEQTWAAANYLTDLPTGPKAAPARIAPAYGVAFPATYPVLNAVTVTFECGYGEASDVPASIIAAIKILVATWYGPGRQAVNIGNITSVIPLTVESLLWPFKSF